VDGFVHTGICRAARGILDDYGMRTLLLDLASRGYAITLVGHSLGAGTASVAAMELKRSIEEIKELAMATAVKAEVEVEVEEVKRSSLVRKSNKAKAEDTVDSVENEVRYGKIVYC
jgi:malonyl CoA-acyl carrier protein transacylase